MARPIGYYLADGLKSDTSLNGGAGGQILHSLGPYMLRDPGPTDFHHIKRHEYSAEFPMLRKVPTAVWADIMDGTDVLERVVLVEWDATNYDEWRIQDVVEVVDAGRETALLKCAAPILDLDTSGLIMRTEADGTARLTFSVGMRTPPTLVDLILGNLSPYVSGPPAYFLAGTIDPTTRVQVFNFDADTAWSALLELEKLVFPYELGWSRNGDTGYLIHLLSQVGGSATPVPLHVERNVFKLTHTSGVRKQVTRVVPRGQVREDGERMTMATNLLEISSIGASTLTMADNIVNEADQWNGFYIRKPDGSRTQITDSAVPADLTVASVSGLSAGNSVSIRLNATGDELVYVPSPSAEATYAVKAKTLVRDDIPPVDNEIPNASMISWSGGLPVGAQTVGSPVVVENTDGRFALWGGKSAHVTASAEGEGLGWAFNVFPTERFPHYTPEIRAYIVSGRIEIQLVDVTSGEVYPTSASQQRADSSRLGWDDIGMAHGENHFELGTSQMELRVVSADGPAEFYIDIVMVTNTADGVLGFYDGRASNQLLIAALDELAIRRLPLSTYSADVADLNRKDAVLYPDEPFESGATAALVAGRLPFEATTRILGRKRFLEHESRGELILETEEDRLTRDVTARRQADIRNPVPPHAQKPGCPLNLQAVLGAELELTWIPALSSFTDLRIAGPGANAVGEWESGQPIGDNSVVDGSNYIVTAPRHTLLGITRVVARSVNRWGVYSDCAVAVDVQQANVSPCANIAPNDSQPEYCSPDSTGNLVIHQYVDLDPRLAGLIDGDPAVYQYEAKTTPTAVMGPPSIDEYDCIALCNQVTAARICYRHYIPGFDNFRLPEAGFSFGAFHKAAVAVEPNGANNEARFRIFDSFMSAKGDSLTDPEHAGDAGVAAMLCKFGGGDATKSRFRRLRVCKSRFVHVSNLVPGSGTGLRFFRETGRAGGNEHGAFTAQLVVDSDSDGAITWESEGWAPYDGFHVYEGSDFVNPVRTVRPSDSVYPGDQYFWDQTLQIATKVDDGLIYERVTFSGLDLGTTIIVVSGSPSINGSGELELGDSGAVYVAMAARDTMYVQAEFWRNSSNSTQPELAALATGNGIGSSDLGALVSVAAIDSGGMTVATKSPAPTKSSIYVKSNCITVFGGLQAGHSLWRFFAERRSTLTQGIACVRRLQVNPGTVCCLYQTPSIGLPPISVDCLISASLVINGVDTCAGGTGVSLTVNWTVDPNGPCLSLDVLWAMEVMWLEEYDPTSFPGDWSLVRHDKGVALPTAGTYTTNIMNEDPDGNGPGNGRGTDGMVPVPKRWKARVILRNIFLSQSGGVLEDVQTAPAYDWCP